MIRKPKIGPTNLVELLEWRAHKTPHAEAYKFPIAHGWGAMTWQQVYDLIRDLTAGLDLVLAPVARAPRCASVATSWD